jgi:hypothetical protein
VMSYPIADSVAQDRHRSMHLSGFFNLCAPSRYRKIYGFYNLAVADPSATRAEACCLVLTGPPASAALCYLLPSRV